MQPCELMKISLHFFFTQLFQYLQDWNSFRIFAQNNIMIEQPPIIKDLPDIKISALPDEVVTQARMFLDQYLYWSDIKYKHINGVDNPLTLWSVIKTIRSVNDTVIYPPYGLHFSLTNRMLRLCHIFDMQFGGKWGNESLLPKENRRRYLIGSIMEEAISSSQMEGASTTRKAAKEMLRKNITPKDRFQRMIFNNYQTITFLSENTSEPLSRELILKIHSLMTDGTMDKPEDSGRFRVNDDVVVENAITHDVVHNPPSCREIEDSIDWLCAFANNDATVFIHPIIKAIIIHFFISYLHPFVDGNGRTARALFHWYLLKSGYWLIEYMSISKVIYKTKTAYEKSFLRAEADGNDIGYFITYNLNALEKAFNELKTYLSRKAAAQNDQNKLLRLGNINQRQAEILYIFLKDEDAIITVKDVSSRFMISPTTAKHDLIGLVSKELLSEIALNRQKHAYVRGPKFSEEISRLK